MTRGSPGDGNDVALSSLDGPLPGAENLHA